MKINSINIVLTGLLLSNYLLSQTGDAEIDPMDALFNQVQSEGAMNQEGQACYDYLSKKRWNDGFNQKKDGSSYFVSVGVARVGAPWSSPNYATSMMNASISAQLNTKSNLAQTMSKEITSKIVTELKQNYSEGKKPDFLNPSVQEPAKNYDELGYMDKFALLVNQQLDKAIDPETKEAFNDQAAKPRELERTLDEVVNSQSFLDNTTAKSNATIRGMKNVFTSFDTSANSNQTIACVVGLWSEKLAKQVDAITTGNYSLLKNQKKGIAISDYIGDEKTKDGYVKLLGTFGTFIVRDDKGEVTVLSYAQEGVKGSTGEQIAFQTAKLRAERAIIQLRQENIDVVQASSNQEITTEYTDGMVDYYAENKNSARVAAAANGTLTGSYVIKRWKGLHLNRKPFVGVVVAWTPSGAELASDAKQIFAKQPKEGSASSNREYMPAEVDATVGSSMGDDEDDF